MLITEAARGEGGRLYYMEGDRRVYFMEEKYGERGNLMPRDIVSKCIYDAPSQVYLDISFLGKKLIASRLSEVAELCRKYAALDVTKQSIPVYPSVHFFMGGLAVGRDHKTSVEGLYAIGECASMYHGANRLGGNSLLAAIYSARVAATSIGGLEENQETPDFQAYISAQQALLVGQHASRRQPSDVHIRHEIARLMNECLGITRSEEKLLDGIRRVDDYLSVTDACIYDSDVSPYTGYALRPLLLLTRAILTSALARKETRGAHIRKDYPEQSDEFAFCSVCKYQDGEHCISYAKEDEL
jgi:succinate dehydrogenase / fumarate reductase flavoprotein subunit